MHHVHSPFQRTPETKEEVTDADALYATFAEFTGAKLPGKLTMDGQSFASQLQGKPGTPRDSGYVQLCQKWFVREANYKMNEAGELFDMVDEGGPAKKKANNAKRKTA